jgi:uncharacterized protein
MALPDPFDRDNTDRTAVKTSFASIPVTHDGRTWHVGAELREPLATTSVPRAAIIIVHGSAGVDSRAQNYAFALNAAGFVTLEIDLWAARGVNSPLERPKNVSETLPDAFAALAFLSARNGIDPRRIGIMGFSWGGIVSMLSATEHAVTTFAESGMQFAAHAPFYPACWVYNTLPGFEFEALTGAPVFIQTGAADLYDDPDTGERLVASLPGKAKAHVTFATYPGATHAWDRKEADITPFDPFAFKGKGGEVPFRYNADVTRQSTEAVVAFFTRALKPAS